MNVVIEKVLLDGLINLIQELLHRHPHTVAADLFDKIQKSIRLFNESPHPEVQPEVQAEKK